MQKMFRWHKHGETKTAEVQAPPEPVHAEPKLAKKGSISLFHLRGHEHAKGTAEPATTDHVEAKPLKKGSLTLFLPSFLGNKGSDETAKNNTPTKGKGGDDASNFEFTNPGAGSTPASSRREPTADNTPKRDSSATPSIVSRTSDLSAATPNLKPSASSSNLRTTPSMSNLKHSASSSSLAPRAPTLSVSLDPAGLPPALQHREENVPTRPPAMSMGQSIIDRYWHLGDVLEDRSVVMSWRLRVLMAFDVAKVLKTLHQAQVAHGALLIDAVLVDQNSRCKVQDTGSMKKTSDSTQMQRDVLFFGTILVQLALHQTLDLGGINSRRSVNVDQANLSEGMPEDTYKTLKKLFIATFANEDTSEMSDSLDFQDALSQEIRALAGFKPKESENVPGDAIGSLEELAVQCCSAMAMNRPEADAIEDWLSAIVDMIGGPEVKAEDASERDKILWALQSNENEILGDVTVAEDSDAFTGKTTATAETSKADDDDSKKEKEKEDGYETDDSFMPPVDTRARRPSRLSMFIEEADKNAPQAPPATTTAALKDEDSKEKKKARPKSRMSIKPTALNIERFAGIHRRASSGAGMVISPAQCRAKFDKQERLSREEIMLLLQKAEEVLRAEPNLPHVQAPVTVVGDIHGQYFDLAHMIDTAGAAGSVKYLFLGDYVDRGDWSCEVLFYILSMKVAYPQHVTMIRGNHECDAVSSYFGFKEEVESKYGRPIFYRCLAIFQCMPVGAVLDTGGAGRFLCVHGGISPHVSSLEQFETINRFQEPGMNGFLCDVLWSDPIKDDFDDGQHGKSLGDFLSIDFVSNPARGCSFRYGYSAIVKFLATNRLVAIIRAHEVMQEGFRYHFQTITGGGKSQARIMPPVITVFSAPNYLGTYGNQGAFLRVSSAKDRSHQGGGFKPIDLLDPVQFAAVPHPVPLVLASETQMQRSTIENACPYMPTTFDSFIAAALEFALGEDDDDEALLDLIPQSPTINEVDDEEKTVFDLQQITRAPGMEHRKRESLEREAKELRQGLSNVKLDMHGVDLAKLLPASTPNRRLSLVELRERKGVSSLIAQFSKAAAVDGINEMHPSLVQEKMSQAKKKLDSAPAAAPVKGKGMPSKPVDNNEQSIMGGAAGGRRTVVANKRTTVVKEGSRSTLVNNGHRRVSLTNKGPGGRSSVINDKDRAQAAIAASEASKTLVGGAPSSPVQSVGPKEVEVDFTEAEIVALQMLYLMIDRDGVGSVKSKELAQWSAADGATISDSDANLCIEALDLDEDGGVGFSDYLAFAARLKLKWEKKTRAADPSF